jgi:ATP adenylyltransferase
MKRLWAPWRMEYILGAKEDECIFCTKPKGGDDKKNLILFRGEHNYVIMNLYPYNNGHLMVVPYRHTSDITGITREEMNENGRLVQRCVEVLKGSFSPEGYNIGMNLETAAGAGIDEHIHMHIVPRWNGDTNFMPVVGDTRVMPQHISESYDILNKGFGEK